MTTVEEFKRAASRQPPLRAPYNFVPLNSKVLETPWRNELDLSKPHPQGICGQLMIEWRVETPLLVGGRDNNSPFQLGVEGPYAIPGASLRGMIRAVLEILSYADLGFYDDQRFSVRDYDSVTWQGFQKEMRGKTTSIIDAKGNDITVRQPLAGWLRKTADGYQLTECDQIEISIADLVARLGLSADQWHSLSLHHRHAKLNEAHLDGVIDLGRISPSLRGQHGTLVVAGLIKSEANRQNRDKGRIKKSELAFIDSAITNTWPISQTAFDAFIAIQVKDGRGHKGPPEEAWSYWERKLWDPELKKGDRIPVFFRGDPGRAAAQVPTPDEFVMALTRLMRFPHRFTTAEIARQTQKGLLPATRLDFVQALFGHVPQAGDETAKLTLDPIGCQRAWRSRVRFAVATLAEGQQAIPMEPRPAVTMKPRASFYPFYLRPAAQAADLRHPVDWSNPAARLAGRKRYPPRDQARAELPRSPKNNPEQENQLIFLYASTDRPLVFQSAIRFHNLLPEELGGLIWAIALRNPAGTDDRRLRHMLGRAKSFGYGQVHAAIRVDHPENWIEANAAIVPPSFAACADAFEKWVTGSLGGDQPFTERPEVAVLLALCDADLGAELREALRFPCSPEAGSLQDEAERILTAYSTIKKRTACRPSRDDPRRQGGDRASQEPGDDRFLFLPSYPQPATREK